MDFLLISIDNILVQLSVHLMEGYRSFFWCLLNRELKMIT